LLSLLAVLTSFCFAEPKKKRFTELSIVLALLLINLLVPSRIIFPLWMKSKKVIPAEHLVLDQWNAISRVTVYKERRNSIPYLWGPSSKVPKDLRTPYYALQIDGCAESPIYQYKKGMNLDFLNYDISTLAYALPSLHSACIIGLGGGRDVLSAYHGGVKEITALDINNVQIDLLSKKEPFVSYAGLQTIPNLNLINNEARSWITSNGGNFDIIQMSLIDTWAATGAGAFALSENGLYTLEAWTTFLSHLNPKGVLTVSRWYLQDAHSETERLMSLATASLLRTGATDPAKHIFLAKSDHLATLVLARDPFSKEQLDALESRVKEEDFTTLLSPISTTESTGTALSEILQAKSEQQLYQRLHELNDRDQYKAYDLSPATDARPFFFNQVRLTYPDKVMQLVLSNTDSAIIGHARAIFHLYLIIVFSIIMVVAVLLYPLMRSRSLFGRRTKRVDLLPGTQDRLAPGCAEVLPDELGTQDRLDPGNAEVLPDELGTQDRLAPGNAEVLPDELGTQDRLDPGSAGILPASKSSQRLAIGGSLWFLLIGLGFMFAEIAFLQRMSTFLGHPSYGLCVVLFSLVLSTGLGSLLSGRLPLTNNLKVFTWIAITAGLAFAEAQLLDQAFLQFQGAGTATRVMLCISLITPLGVLFGFGFPTGMRIVEGGDTNLTAWFWGLNGAASVLGSAIGVAISIAWGLDATMLVASACYLLLLVPTLMLKDLTASSPN
jgi:spermidine synthase